MAYNLNFAYNSSTNSYKVTGATGTGTSIVIPSAYNGPQGILPVTIIDTNAFIYFLSLTSIIIPDTIIEIRQNALFQTSISTIYIPKNVSSIEQNVFANCNFLTSITVDIDNETYSSDSGILYNKEQTTLLVYPPAKNGNSFTIPTQVTTLGPQAIRYALYLTTINITQNVISADVNKLPYVGLQTINVDSQNSNYSSEFGILYNKNKTSLLLYPSAKQDISFNIPNTVTSIHNFGFQNVSILQNITFSNNLTNIGILFCNSATSLQKIFFLGNAPSLDIVPFSNANINLKVYRYSTKSGWSSTFGGKDVLLIDAPSKGLKTFGFSGVSSGKTSIKKQNRTKLEPYSIDGGSTIYDANNVYVFKGGSINTLGVIFDLTPAGTIGSADIISFNGHYYYKKTGGFIGAGWRDENSVITDRSNTVIDPGTLIYFNPRSYKTTPVEVGAIIEKYNNPEGRVSLSFSCGYQNTSKLAEISGSDAPIGGTFNNIAFNYSSFANSCSSLGFDPATILNSLGGVNFSSNYVVIRAKTSSSISNDSISDLGGGIINITNTGFVSPAGLNYYRFFVMCRAGWNTVRFFGVDYPI